MAWSFVGAGSTATANSDDITLTEHASVQEGDLLIAGIAYRGTPTFTVPSPWRESGDDYGLTLNSGSNTATDSTRTAAGFMARTIRGASAPTLVFPRTGGSAAIGVCLAFRCDGTPTWENGYAGGSGTPDSYMIVPLPGSGNVASAAGLYVIASWSPDFSVTNSFGDDSLATFTSRFNTGHTVPPAVSLAIGSAFVSESTATTYGDVSGTSVKRLAYFDIYVEGAGAPPAASRGFRVLGPF